MKTTHLFSWVHTIDDRTQMTPDRLLEEQLQNTKNQERHNHRPQELRLLHNDRYSFLKGAQFTAMMQPTPTITELMYVMLMNGQDWPWRSTEDWPWRSTEDGKTRTTEGCVAIEVSCKFIVTSHSTFQKWSVYCMEQPDYRYSVLHSSNRATYIALPVIKYTTIMRSQCETSGSVNCDFWIH